MPLDTPPAPNNPTSDNPTPNTPTHDASADALTDAPPPRQFRVPLILAGGLIALAVITYDFRCVLQYAWTRKYIEQQCAIGTQWSEAEKSMITAGVPTRKLTTLAVEVGYKDPPASLLLYESICRQAGSDAALKLGTWWTQSTRHIYLLDTTGTIIRQY